MNDAPDQSAQGAVASYKRVLLAVFENRPSGTRQRVADAIGSNRSFVSQMANPAYAMPIPANHLPAIFAVCHFSAAERAAFLDAYARAHPGRLDPAAKRSGTRRITLTVPDLGDPRRNREVDLMVADLVRRIGRFADDITA